MVEHGLVHGISDPDRGIGLCGTTPGFKFRNGSILIVTEIDVLVQFFSPIPKKPKRVIRGQKRVALVAQSSHMLTPACFFCDL